MRTTNRTLLAAFAITCAVACGQQPYTKASMDPGTSSKQSMGWMAAPAGDVDLDGHPDVLLGFPYNKSNSYEPITDILPAPFVAGTSGFHVWSPATGTFIRTIVEPGLATRGFALVNLGDIDGDGRPDHAASDPFHDRVDAYSGATGSVIWSFVSTVVGSKAGVSLARIADVDVDGVPDLLVGAPGASGMAGRVFVLSATTGSLLRTHVGVNDDTLGFGTTDAGDVDNDGVSDYAAGAPRAIGSQAPGYVRIWSGATGGVIRTVAGVINNDRFGRALAPAGDLNGDLVPDLFVGAPATQSASLAGHVYAISGSDGSVLLNATRNVGADRFGWSLCAIGDRNGDGKTDFAVGTCWGLLEARSGAYGGVLVGMGGLLPPPQTNGSIMRPFLIGDINGDGLVDAAIGSPDTSENGMLTVFISVVPGVSLFGEDGLNFTDAVAALGDLDGDGIRDLAMGDSHKNANGILDSGAVFLWSTGAAALIADLGGASQGARFGYAISTLDDVDQDGIEDFLVSAPVLIPVPNAPNAGTITCYSGATRVPIYTTTGTTPLGFFGYSIARLSDLDGDGVRDFAGGAPWANPGTGSNAGQVHVCSGATGAILHTINGATAYDSFGWAISEVGDIDGDGKADLIVGAPWGTVGSARLVSGATGAILRTHIGTVIYAGFGNDVCGLRDVDNDGVADYAISSPSIIQAGGVPGPVRVYSGATGLQIRTIGNTPVNTNFGLGLSNAGDLDGDGYDDIVLGAGPWTSGFPPPYPEIHAYSGANGSRIVRQQVSGSFLPTKPSTNASAFDLTGDGAPDWVAFSAEAGSAVLMMSRAGIPPASTSVGGGCNLGSGLPPVLQTGGGPLVAAAGNPQFEFLVSRAAPNQSGVISVGVSNSIFNGQPLPLDLSIFGLPGCFLYNSADILIPFVATPDGQFGLPKPLPANPALAGMTTHYQAFLVDAMGAVVTSSNGLTLVVQ